MRVRLARTIGRMVLEADGFEPADPKLSPSYSRVREYRDEFLAVAFHLARPASRVHPTAVAMMERLLTHATMSPLYNERLPVTQVRTALHRVQLAIDGSPERSPSGRLLRLLAGRRDERHHRAQLGADDLDLVPRTALAEHLHAAPPGLVLAHELARELAGLDLLEDLASSRPCVSGPITRGPRVRSPYSAVSEIE